ncbi:MAG: hypothetical protein JWQ95_5878 [Sphaerisporangium sp.]|jgi:hypothetical protein|nr:hypothetical protein [Sphaerisporangium sp.]
MKIGQAWAGRPCRFPLVSFEAKTEDSTFD